ncbi:MAG: hypothetical protein LUQ36_08725 [Methanoregula sp.]|jgi:hypothetical protein|nr:hypothetical protein [Methanoregula sp.]
MPKIPTKTGVYSSLLMSILIITVCAGCTEPSATTGTPVPATTSDQPKFVEGDIIAKTASSPDLFFLILSYDATKDQYERAFVNKKSDGSWFRSNDKSELADRILVETVYPAKVGHVISPAQITIETLSNNIPSPSTPALTPAPASPSAKTPAQTAQPDPFVGTWTFTNSYEENGTILKVVCTHQFVSSGNFSHFCAGQGEQVQQPDYGKWENLGDNSYVIMYPDENNPEQPYGFYEGFYYYLSYNPDLDTLTLVTEMIQDPIILTRVQSV